MKIATYNVNSVNARLENLTAWLAKNQPDAVMLQEIKSEFNAFPFFELQTAGYDVHILWQKSYNGVAVLTKAKSKVVCEGLPDFEDENARYLEVEVVAEGQPWRLASIYLPNGNPPYNNPDDDSKWLYKLKWMEAFYRHAEDLLSLRQPIVFGGDFNVILRDDDVYNPDEFRKNALFRPEVRQRLRAFEYLGYYDAWRTQYPQKNGYTFWDYAGASLAQDLGMRIDYLWLNSYAVDKLISVEVDKKPRQSPKPSDHTVLKAVFD